MLPNRLRQDSPEFSGDAVKEYLGILADVTGVTLSLLSDYITIFVNRFKKHFRSACLQSKLSYKSLYIQRMVTRLHPDMIRWTPTRDQQHILALKAVADYFMMNITAVTQYLPDDQPFPLPQLPPDSRPPPQQPSVDVDDNDYIGNAN